MTTYLKSYGMSERYILENDKNKQKPKQSFNRMEWKGDYDGNKAHININVNDNGHREHMNMVLNNRDLIEILNVPEVNVPIHQRLEKDFLLKDKNENANINNKTFSPLVLGNLLQKTRKYRKKHKRHYNKSSRSSTSSRRSYSNSSSKSSKSSKSKKMEKLLSLH